MKNDVIRALSDKEQVFQKLPVFYGSYDNYQHGFKELINNSIDEITTKFDNGIITVVMQEDNRTITVEDTGRGLPVADVDSNGVQGATLLFETLFAGGKYDSNDATGGTNGVGLTCLALSSELFIAEVCNKGRRYITEYRNGDKTMDLTDLGKTDKHGTKITFRLNPNIYTNTVFDGEEIEIYLNKIAKASNKVTINYTYYKSGQEINKSFNYESLEEYFEEHEQHRMIKSIMGGVKSYKSMEKVRLADGSKGGEFESTNEIELILNCSQSETLLQETMLNGIDLIEPNNTIRNGVLDGVRDFVNSHCKKEKLYTRSEKELTREDVEQALTFICKVSSNRVEFENQTKFGTKKALYGKIVREYIKEVLEVYSIENKAHFEIMVKQILICKRARDKSESIRQNVKKQLSEKLDNSMFSRVEGLTDSKYHDEKSELFIAEGKSAKGSIELARDPKYHAVYAIRGKILSCLKASDETILSNQVIKDLIKVMGCGVELKSKKHKDLSNFDINNLRYGKIVIATDADPDGEAIVVLILTMIYRLMKDLLTQEKVYIAQTPLFVVTELKTDKKHYAFSEKEKDDILSKINGKCRVGRIKGLGELNSEDMYNTALNPETRQMMKVKIEDVEEMISKFELWMSDDITPRKEFIENNLYRYLTDEE